MFLFTPTHLKHGRQFLKDARKLVAYKRDIAPADSLAKVNGEIAKLEEALKSKDRERIGTQMRQLDEACGLITTPVEDAGWRENVEVIVVAIIIALAVRTYFLQPFAIPTGSMSPTLHGIVSTPTTTPPPNPVSRVIQKALFWRTYYDVVAQADESVLTAEDEKRFLFFDRCILRTTAGNTYSVGGTRATLETVGLSQKPYKKGEPIVRGYTDTGDHVFVDKITYHFIRPRRDQVFVFSTSDIPLLVTRDANGERKPSQYYIKRLAGLPGDTLRIDPPRLFINGAVPQNFGFQRVMAGTENNKPNVEYRGYGFLRGGLLLTRSDEAFQVPEKRYFALGDNSYNSYDSRGWETVPQHSIMGRALFVYYPFTSHFGLIW